MCGEYTVSTSLLSPTSAKMMKIGNLKHCFWLWLSLAIVLAIETPSVSSHAPPRSMYYNFGHRVSPKDQLQYSVSVPVSVPASSRLYESDLLPNQFPIPSCSQLRYIWKTAANNLFPTKDGSTKKMQDVINGMFADGIPVILSNNNNPYYETMLVLQPDHNKQHQSQQQQSQPHFGKIVASPTQSSTLPLKSTSTNKVPRYGKEGHPRDASESEQSTMDRQQQQDHPQSPIYRTSTSNMPGQLSGPNDAITVLGEGEGEAGVVFGHVIHSPAEIQNRKQILERERDRIRDRERGRGRKSKQNAQRFGFR